MALMPSDELWLFTTALFQVCHGLWLFTTAFFQVCGYIIPRFMAVALLVGLLKWLSFTALTSLCCRRAAKEWWEDETRWYEDSRGDWFLREPSGQVTPMGKWARNANNEYVWLCDQYSSSSSHSWAIG